MFKLFKSKDLQISKISSADLFEVSMIHKASFSKGWEDGAIAEMLKTAGVSGLVAKRSGQKSILAFIIFRTVAKESEVITIATAENARRTGAGKALMQEFIRDSLTNRLEELFLEVDENNKPAVSLYKSLGFKKVGEREGYYQAKGKDSGTIKNNALIMRLDLTA